VSEPSAQAGRQLHERAFERLFERLTPYSGVYFDATRLIEKVVSPFQTIEIFDTPDLGKLMRIDGCNMVNERDEFLYHEALVHPMLIAHPSPRRVLVVGGGDGGTAEEVLKHRVVDTLVLAELDGAVVDLARRHFASVHCGVFDSPRLQLRIGDGFAFLASCEAAFDAILLDLTDPIGPAEALYTSPFYAACRRALAPGGAITLHLGSPFSHADRVRATLRTLRATFAHVTPWFVHIPMYGATWGFACASDTLQPRDISAAEVASRLAARGVGDLRLYSADTHQALMTLPPYIAELVG
jgi:spermidine synthase